MTALTSFDTAMAADGEYSFPTMQPGILVVVELSGSFDNGIATLGFVAKSGTFVAFKDGTGTDISTTTNAAWEVRTPPSGTLAVSIDGISDEAAITLTAILCPQ